MSDAAHDKAAIERAINDTNEAGEKALVPDRERKRKLSVIGQRTKKKRDTPGMAYLAIAELVGLDARALKAVMDEQVPEFAAALFRSFDGEPGHGFIYLEWPSVAAVLRDPMMLAFLWGARWAQAEHAKRMPDDPEADHLRRKLAEALDGKDAVATLQRARAERAEAELAELKAARG